MRLFEGRIEEVRKGIFRVLGTVKDGWRFSKELNSMFEDWKSKASRIEWFTWAKKVFRFEIELRYFFIDFFFLQEVSLLLFELEGENFVSYCSIYSSLFYHNFY